MDDDVLDAGSTDTVDSDGAVPGMRPAKEVTLASLRRWLVALTVIAGSIALMCMGVIGFALYETMSMNEAPSDPGLNPAMEARLGDAIAGSFGDSLETVDVYQVALTYDEELSDIDRPFAVTYRLKGIDTTVIGLVDDIAGLGESGLDPTVAALNDQLSEEQFKALLAVWAQQTDAPMGYTYPYLRALRESGDYDTESYAEVVVDGRTFKSDELWEVNEGWAPERGRTTTWDDDANVNALVFRLDPETNLFNYVGKEPAPITAAELLGGWYGD